MMIYYRDELQSYVKASVLQALRGHAECIQKERGIHLNLQGDGIDADTYKISALFKIYQNTFGTREWLTLDDSHSWQEDLRFIFRYQGKTNPHALLTTMKEVWYYGPHILKSPVSTYSREVKSYARQIHIEFYRIKSAMPLTQTYLSPKGINNGPILTIHGNYESKHEIGDLLAFELLQSHPEACIVLQSHNWTYIGYQQTVFKMRNSHFQFLDLEHFVENYNAQTIPLITSARVMKRSGAKVVAL